MLLPRAASPATPAIERGIATVAILAGLLAAALSGSRSAWLAVPLLLAVYAFSLARGQQPLRRFGWPLAMLVATGLLALVPGVPLGERIVEAIDSLRGSDSLFDPFDTLAVRWELWQVAFATIAEHPLIGGGPGAFRAAMESAAAAGALPTELLRYEHPHNQYLSALVINGLPGLLSLLALFGVPLALAARGLHADCRTTRQTAWSTIAAVAVLAVVALGESIFQRNAGVVWFGLLTALTLARARAESPRD
nr:O-antigen ligase family protein [Wenzhouxiangella sp. XN79A]